MSDCTDTYIRITYSNFQVQTRQVLDAMFKKQVQKGEGIIKQGDDGDNFYVIER